VLVARGYERAFASPVFRGALRGRRGTSLATRPSIEEVTMKLSCIAVVESARVRIYTLPDLDRLRDTIERCGATAAQFAREVVAALDRHVHVGGYAHVIAVATPEILGELQRADRALHRADLVIDNASRVAAC
jgi:hypothetical protein